MNSAGLLSIYLIFPIKLKERKIKILERHIKKVSAGSMKQQQELEKKNMQQLKQDSVIRKLNGT